MSKNVFQVGSIGHFFIMMLLVSFASIPLPAKIKRTAQSEKLLVLLQHLGDTITEPPW